MEIILGETISEYPIPDNIQVNPPIIIYGLNAGRPGTSISRSLGLMADIIEEIKPNSIFNSRTIDGLAKALESNKGNVTSVNDEFANFMENLDNGAKKNNMEKSRISTL